MIEFRWRRLDREKDPTPTNGILEDINLEQELDGSISCYREFVELQYREWPRDMCKHMTPEWHTVEISDD